MVLSLIYNDLVRTADRGEPAGVFSSARLVVGELITTRGWAIVGVRLSYACGRHVPFVGGLIKQITHVLTGAEISYRAKIGPGLRIKHPTGIVIAAEVVIGSDVTIQQGVTLGFGKGGCPVIGDGVGLAPGCKILGGVEVGDRCVVGANAVLTKTIPGTDLILAGVPARVLGRTDGAPTE